MSVDYQKLCVNLFGTDDVKTLTSPSHTIGKKNTRNAGRKKIFTSDNIADIRDSLAAGVSTKEIAEKYHTSRQVVEKYINKAPEPGYTMRMTYYFRNRPCTIIDVNFEKEEIMIQNRTADIVHRAFGVVEDPTWDDFNEFLKYRCVPQTRGNIKKILADLSLTSYDPLQIIEKTQGRLADDDMWVKIKYYPSEVLA